MFDKRVTVAITGASGVQYGLRLIELLVKANVQVFVMISKAAQIVMATETDFKLSGQAAAQQAHLITEFSAKEDQIKVFNKEQWFSPVASGSSAPSAMVVVPCSTGCLSAIATGASNNLIERAADVVLKERRKLILVPRETPYSEIHLEHMLKLTRMGAIIMPASPGLYHKPESIADLIDFIVARLLDHLDVDQSLIDKWGESAL
ncbi:aromatic acid decarboxylase [Marinomonas sp. 42_23_T18]|nr:aromatic acid decarboxylase [Marinomonas sp. 42_23_T18]